jgi:ferredoxin-NADP reductase
MLQLKIEAIKWESPDTATFFLKDTRGGKLHYQAGQFITLIFSHHDQEIRRSYSLSSSPDEKLAAITVKRIANGEISRFMLTKMKPGDRVRAVEPAGKFTIGDAEQKKDIFLFAAGSGIAPVLSQLKYALSRAGLSRFTLIYSNQNANSILFRDQLDALMLAYPQRLKVIHLLSNQGNRLNNVLVERLVTQNMHFGLPGAAFLLCGPFAYMRMIRLTLTFMGARPAQIRKENFVVETIAVSASEINYPPGRIKLRFRGELHDIQVGENQSILQAALQNNVPLPYSCRAGMCSACMAICKTGRVAMAENDVLTEEDLAGGWVLTCTGHPVGDDVLLTFDP